jgi:hypothetical protein
MGCGQVETVIKERLREVVGDSEESAEDDVEMDKDEEVRERVVEEGFLSDYFFSMGSQ